MQPQAIEAVQNPSMKPGQTRTALRDCLPYRDTLLPVAQAERTKYSVP